jgi:hypothetical protein
MMHRRAVLVPLLATALALPACGASGTDTASPGKPASPGRESPSGPASSGPASSTPAPPGTSAPGSPDDAVSSGPLPGGTPPSPGQNAKLVTPKPGATIGPKARRWDRAVPAKDGRSVRIYYTSGVEPCHVLDRVEVKYTDRVIVTLFEGTDRRALKAVCIDLAVFNAVDVRLDQPIGARTVVDGAPR